jgi:type II secretory pathway pseudopilin PulG
VLPVGVVLIALALLGLLTVSISYTRTRARVRRAIAHQRLQSLRIADAASSERRPGGTLAARAVRGRRIQEMEVER